MRSTLKIFALFFYSFALFFNLHGQVKTENNDFSYGSKLYEQGFYKLAIQQYETFVKNFPNSSLAPEATFNIGMSYYKMENYDQARDAFQTMAVSYPESPKALQAWYYVGLCDEQLNHFEAAAKAFTNIRLLAPEDPLAAKSLYRAALNYFKISKLIEAENSVRGVMDRYQESMEYIPAQLLMGQIYLSRSQYEIAQNWFQKVILASGKKNEMQTMEAHKYLAKVFIEQGRFTEALHTYNNIEISSTSKLLKTEGALGQLETFLLMNRLDEANEKLNAVKNYSFTEEQRKNYRQFQLIYFILTDQGGKAYQVGQLLLGDGDSKSMAYYSQVLLELNKYSDLIKIWKENPLELDNKDPYKTIFVFNVLRAGFRSDAPEISDMITQIYAHYGKSKQFSNVLAEELVLAYGQNKTDLILQWGGYFIRNYPSHPRADEISWWVAQKTDNPVLKRDKERQVIERYPVGDFKASSHEDDVYPDRREDYPFLFEHFLDLQVKMVSTRDQVQIIPDLAETYLLLGKAKKARDLLQYVDEKKLLPENRLRAMYLLGVLSLGEYRNDSENLALLSKCQNYFKFVVAKKDSNIYLEPASEKLVEVSLILMDEGTEKQEKVFQFYQALIKNFPRSQKRNIWLLKMAESQLPLIKDKNDEAFKNTINSLTQILSDTDFSKQRTYWQAKYYLAFAMDKVGNINQALEHYGELVEKAPESIWQMRSLLAVYRLQAKDDPQQAGLKLYKLLDTYSYASAVWKELDNIPLSLWPDNTGKFMEKRFIPIQVLDPLFRDQDKNNLKIANYLAEFYLYHKNFARALDKLNYIYIQDDNSKKDIRLLSELATAADGLKQMQAALWYWSEVAKLANGEVKANANYQRAKILFDSGSFNKVTELTDDIELDKLNNAYRISFHLMAYSSYLKLGKKSLSERYYADNKNDFKKNMTLASGALISLGDYYLTSNNYDKAMKTFLSAQKKGRKTEYLDDAVFKQIQVKVRLNKVQEAFEAFSQFLQKFPNSNRKAEVYMTLAQLYYRSEKIDEALKSYKKALASAENDDIWQMAAANTIKMSFDMGLYNSALTLAREYIEKVPEAHDATDKKILIGRCYARLGQRDLAINYLKQLKLQVSAEIEPEIQFAIGEIYFNDGQYETAIVEFLKIPVMSKKTKLQWEASALYLAGQSYEKLGRIEEAIRMYQEIINRPGIMSDLKKAARDRIKQIQS